MKTRARVDRTQKETSAQSPAVRKANHKEADSSNSEQGSLRRQVQRFAHKANIPAADLIRLQHSIGNKAVARLLDTQAIQSAASSNQASSSSADVSGGKSGGGKGADEFYLELAQDRGALIDAKGVSGGKDTAQSEIQRFAQTHNTAQIEAVQRQLLGGHAGTDQSGVLRRKGNKSAKTVGATGSKETTTDTESKPLPAPNTLTKTTVKGPTALPRGGFHWVVQWKLSKPSQAGGWIIQGVNIQSNANGPKGKLPTGFDPFVPYWEAWRVNPGQSVTNYAETGDLEDDTFANPSFPEESEGDITEAGNAVFYEGQNLPSSFSVQPKHPAGMLPVAKAAPTLPGGTSVLVHNLTASWTKKKDITAITVA